MDGIDLIKEDLRQGRLDPERVVELLVRLQRELARPNVESPNSRSS